MKSTLTVPLTGLVAGICLAMVGLPVPAGIVLIVSGCLLLIRLQYLSKDPVTGYRLSNIHYIWIFTVFAGIGVFDYGINSPFENDIEISSLTVATGRVKDLRTATSGDIAIVDLAQGIDKTGKIKKIFNCTVEIRSAATRIAIDDKISFPAKFLRIADSGNHFPTGYAEAMKRKGILYTTRCEPEAIRITGHAMTISGISANIRDNLESFIEKAPLERNTRNFLITILLGDRRYLPIEKREAYSAVGISHILALSGMHTAIIAGIILFLLFPINFFGMFKYRLLISCLLLFVYTFITGWSPSTVRATIMATVAMTCLFLERKNSSWHALLIATFLILLINPEAVADVGLQLSFACVCSLIFLTDPLNPINHHDHPRLYKVCTALLCTFSSVAGTWCLSAYYFGTVPVMFLPANIIIVSFLPLYLIISIIFLAAHATGITALPGLSTLSDYIGKTLDTTLSWTDSFINYLSGNGEAVIRYTPTVYTVILWLAVVIMTAMILNGKNNKFVKTGLISATLLFIISIPLATSTSASFQYIIGNNAGAPEIAYRTDATQPEQSIVFKRQALSEFKAGENRIVNLDCPIDELAETECDILLLSGGIRNTLSEIMMRIHASQVVIHPSVRKAREERLLSEADSLSIPCHSIRKCGVFSNM